MLLHKPTVGANLLPVPSEKSSPCMHAHPAARSLGSRIVVASRHVARSAAIGSSQSSATVTAPQVAALIFFATA